MSREEPGKIGRRTTLTAEIVEAIVEGIRAGNYANAVLAAAGIPERTYYRWLSRGEDAERAIDEAEEKADETGEYVHPELSVYETLCLHLRQSVTRADAEVERLGVAEWREASAIAAVKGDHRPVMDFLERRFRKRWAKRTEITGADGESISDGIVKLVVEPSPATRPDLDPDDS